MERGVEFGWRVEQLKYMAWCSVVNGEYQLARKYLGLLKQTMYHGEWAEHVCQLIEHPEDIAKSPEMEFINHMMHYDDELAADHNLVENFLMKRLMLSNYTSDPVFLEQVVLATMASKDSKYFWPHLYNYSILYPDRGWPVHVQEAAMLFGSLENKRNIDQWPTLSATVKESYRRFDELASRFEGAEWETANAALHPTFGNTYFYDYYMINFPAQN